VGHSRPLISFAPPLSVIDDTKVRMVAPSRKNNKGLLLTIPDFRYREKTTVFFKKDIKIIIF